MRTFELLAEQPSSMQESVSDCDTVLLVALSRRVKVVRRYRLPAVSPGDFMYKFFYPKYDASFYLAAFKICSLLRHLDGAVS